MKCPLCQQPIHQRASKCPHCGRDGSDLNILYQECDTKIQLLHDRAGILRHKERLLLNEWIIKFGKEFPSCVLSVHAVVLNDQQDAKSYGIWALNHPEYSDLPEQKNMDSALCLVIDVHKKEICLSYGYQLEPFLSSESCFNAISAAHPYLLDESYIEALGIMRHGIRKMMQAKSRASKSILKRKKLLNRIIRS